MVRLDISEFMERHTVSKLIGSPLGYVGYTEAGQLTDAVRHRHYTVPLFNEIEKVHPDFFNIMLQILDDGRLTDSKDFDLTYSDNDGGYSSIKNLVIEELKKFFPEFLNQLDDIIIFKQLTKPKVKVIADIMPKEVCWRLKAKDIILRVTDKFDDRVIEEGNYGARHLRRAIMRLLEDCMAEKMLAKEINGGHTVILDVDAVGNVVVLNGSDAFPEFLFCVSTRL
ncbi:hypothetical protein RND81_02G046000 [Saponaria officinalis]|uniref:Clp ATPase C-terminal domain-containing protein n=1 Tax=Saponaria officinalis TaxID=3572 RepID=A0AAW1MN30_SAPOF